MTVSQKRERREHRKVVALGGGHGLHASLSGMRRVTRDLTAIVTVADDGGSSGRLRREFGVLPPGDLRMALAALCGDDVWGTTWSRVIQHRFSGTRPAGAFTAGPARAESGGVGSGLAGHTVGNVLIVARWELLGDTVEGLDWVGRLLGANGRVLPMAAVPLDLAAEVEGADPDRPLPAPPRSSPAVPAENRYWISRLQVVPHSSSPQSAASAIRRSPGGSTPNSRRSRPLDPPSSATVTIPVRSLVTRRSPDSDACKP